MIPTDTVYGVAAVLEDAAIAKLFVAKGRPADRPIPVLAAGAKDLARIVDLDDKALALATELWPGPLTLVLPRSTSFTIDLGGASATVGVRVPDSEIARAIMTSTGPLAVTSANRSGEAPARTVAEARKALGDAVGAFIDGGLCDGMPSTVVELSGDRAVVLREGGVPAAAIQKLMS